MDDVLLLVVAKSGSVMLEDVSMAARY